MKTVLFVLDYFSPHQWGVENVFENIIFRLKQKWYKIVILTSHHDIKLKKHENKNGIEIYRTGKSRISFMIKSLFVAKKIFENNQIDVVHGSTYGAAIPAAVIAKKFNKKIILTVHEIFGDLWYFYKWIIVWIIYKLFEKIIFSFKYDVYHCVSNNTARDLKKYYKIDGKKIKVIHNGIDDKFWDGQKVTKEDIEKRREKNKWSNNFVFWYFGHAGKSKWIDYLISALPNLLKLKNTVFVFNIIESKRTKKILNKLKKIQNQWNQELIKIYNWFSKEDLRIFVASCNCIIAPSISEGFGSVHTETAAMWIPLITTKTSAIPEVVFGKIKFIKPKNTKDIINAVKDIKEKKYQNIKKKIFNWDDTVSEIEKLY